MQTTVEQEKKNVSMLILLTDAIFFSFSFFLFICSFSKRSFIIVIA